MDTPDISTTKRQRINVTDENLVRTALNSGHSPPLVVEPAVAGVNLFSWAERNRSQIETWLLSHGALLFRAFKVDGAGEFQKFIEASGSEKLVQYSYASTPRTAVSGSIYTSTEYPRDQFIPLHNEMSYARAWPRKAWFFCRRPADRGGQTPLADSRKVYRRIAPQIREELAHKRVQYVRNYDGRLDLAWQDVFNTSDKSAVESFCENQGIEWEWLEGDRLRTRQTCQAVATHPQTSEDVWFNQAHLFHVSSLGDSERELILAEFDPQDLPRNAYYGDGSPIDSNDLEQIRAAYRAETISFCWQPGDILMLDNMLMAHGRTPFEGDREILVGMAEMLSDQSEEAKNEE